MYLSAKRVSNQLTIAHEDLHNISYIFYVKCMHSYIN